VLLGLVRSVLCASLYGICCSKQKPRKLAVPVRLRICVVEVLLVSISAVTETTLRYSWYFRSPCR
jgi:hypothetical protein